MKTLYKNIDKWLKISLLVISQIVIVALTIVGISFLCISDEQYKHIYPDENTLKLVLQVKDSFKILLWFLVPFSILIIPINIYKFYLWIMNKKESKEKKIKKERGK